MAEHYDIPWKQALDRLLQPFLALFFSEVHDAIDWAVSPENLETELESLTQDAVVGNRRADKLFRVRLKSGQDKMLLLHVEVQTTVDRGLPERIMIYWYRIFDHYGERPISLVLLGDESRDWRPNVFREEMLGFSIEVKYPVMKLLDLTEEELDRKDNPMAIVGVAYLKARATSRRPAERLEHKVELVKRLLEKGYPEDLVVEVFRLLDWMLALPRPIERQFRERVKSLKENPDMRYVTSIERLAREEGRQEGRKEGRQEGRQEGRKEGRQEGLEEGRNEGRLEGLRNGQAALISRLLEHRFGDLSPEHVARLRSAGLEQLSRWGERVLASKSIDEVFAAN